MEPALYRPLIKISVRQKRRCIVLGVKGIGQMYYMVDGIVWMLSTNIDLSNLACSMLFLEFHNVLGLRRIEISKLLFVAKTVFHLM
jgi:hypothetical protein